MSYSLLEQSKNHATNFFSPDMNSGHHAVHVKTAPIVMHFLNNSVFCFWYWCLVTAFEHVFSIILDSSAIKYAGSYFGEGQGAILMDNVHCTGKEKDIAGCSFSGWGNHNCRHSKDVSVKCNKRKILSCCERLSA